MVMFKTVDWGVGKAAVQTTGGGAGAQASGGGRASCRSGTYAWARVGSTYRPS